MAEKQYAFWEYDTFPFVLSGVVGRPNAEGLARVKGYDRRFKPLRIVYGAKGKTMGDNLEWLKRQYQDAQLDLKRDYCLRALAFAPFLKDCKRTSAYDIVGRTRKATRVALA